MSREEAIDLLDNLLGMVDDNQENDYDTAFKMGIKALKQITKIADIVDGTIDHFDYDDAMDVLYEIKGVVK